MASCSNSSGGGSEGNGNNNQNESPQAPAGCVYVSKKFFDGKTAITGSKVFIANRQLSLPAIFASDHEITQKEYTTYCQYGGGDVPSDTYGVGDNYPAYYISWYDAIVYCNLKSKTDGLTPCYKLGTSTDAADVTKWTDIVKEGDGANAKYCGPSSDNAAWNAVTFDTAANGWRLPTEAEWEMLARGGNLTNSNQTTYSGSNTIGDVAWYKDNSDERVHEGKGKKKNGLDLYDMSGNVEEWCWDCQGTITATTPATGASHDGSYRVGRGGGSWSYEADFCSVAYRHHYISSFDRNDNLLGFRVVRNAQ